MSEGRSGFVDRPTKGKTLRKRLFPPKGIKTNVGDPNNKFGSGKKSGKKKDKSKT